VEENYGGALLPTGIKNVDRGRGPGADGKSGRGGRSRVSHQTISGQSSYWHQGRTKKKMSQKIGKASGIWSCSHIKIDKLGINLTTLLSWPVTPACGRWGESHRSTKSYVKGVDG